MAEIVQIISALGKLVELTSDGQVTLIGKNGTRTTVFNNPNITMLAGAPDSGLYLLEGGLIKVYYDIGVFKTIDNTTTNHAILYSSGKLYTLRQGGQLLRREGNSGNVWKQIDNNPDNYMGAVDGDRAYVLHRGGQLWSLEPTGWTNIDENTENWSVVANGGKVYVTHGGINVAWGQIWSYDGTPHHWTCIADVSSDHRALVAVNNRLFRVMSGGACLLYSGVPKQWNPVGNLNNITPEQVSIGGGAAFLEGNPEDPTVLALTALMCLFGAGAAGAALFASDGLLGPTLGEIFQTSGAITACGAAAYQVYQHFNYTPPSYYGSCVAPPGTHRLRRNTGRWNSQTP
jgi:hypothetical protein